MNVELIDYHDNWQAVKDATMTTIGKRTGRYPDSMWKWRLLMAEHSPIRLLTFRIRFTDIPYWVVMHLVRHKVGVEHFVSTQRTDRTGTDRSGLPQDNLVNYEMVADAQALINISRKRLCMCASPETRDAWMAVVEAIRKVEPELASCMVPECVYRGHCTEINGCGYVDTPSWQMSLIAYRSGSGVFMKIK